MKHSLTILPSPAGASYAEFDYSVQFEKTDASVLPRNITALRVPFPPKPVFLVLDETGQAQAEPQLLVKDVVVSVPGLWKYSDAGLSRTFDNTEVREAYIYLRTLKFTFEHALIRAARLAKFEGFNQTFDVRVDVPRSILDFERFRRSIMIQ